MLRPRSVLLRVQLAIAALVAFCGCDAAAELTLQQQTCHDARPTDPASPASALACVDEDAAPDADARSRNAARVSSGRVTIPVGRDTVRGHVMSVPTAFEVRDGSYDLVVHFHGNTEAVEESYRRAAIDAVVVIVNLGEGADVYERAFADPSALSRMRRRVDDKLHEHGVADPRLRRMALSAWSAGYGAVMRVIDQDVHRQKLDAVLLLDGMHAAYTPVLRDISLGDVQPFLRLAERAARDELTFFVSHSRIQPENPDLASVHETADLVLSHVGAKRKKVDGDTAPPEGIALKTKPLLLDAVRGIYSQRSMIAMEARSVAIQGGLVVVEYFAAASRGASAADVPDRAAAPVAPLAVIPGCG